MHQVKQTGIRLFIALQSTALVGVLCVACVAEVHDSETAPDAPDSNSERGDEVTGEAQQELEGFPAPVFIQPSTNVCYSGTYIPFEWTSISGATAYRLQVSKYWNNFGVDDCGYGCEHNQVYSNGSFRYVFLPSGTHYARVRAGNPVTGQGGYWSSLLTIYNGP